MIQTLLRQNNAARIMQTSKASTIHLKSTAQNYKKSEIIYLKIIKNWNLKITKIRIKIFNKIGEEVCHLQLNRFSRQQLHYRKQLLCLVGLRYLYGLVTLYK